MDNSRELRYRSQTSIRASNPSEDSNVDATIRLQRPAHALLRDLLIRQPMADVILSSPVENVMMNGVRVDSDRSRPASLSHRL